MEGFENRSEQWSNKDGHASKGEFMEKETDNWVELNAIAHISMLVDLEMAQGQRPIIAAQ